MIELQDVNIRYGSGKSAVTAAKNISLRIAPGETLGLVGESGSGKSTVLRAVAGLNNNVDGLIRIGGEAVGPVRTKDQYRRVQMVFQDPFGSLHPRHTVDRVLAQPLQINGISDIENRIGKALREVGLGPEHRYRFPHQLSGGQRQRVAIARALILEPQILLLDEPTSALDVSVQAEILNLLSMLRRSYGLTMFLVSHDLAVVTHMCDRVAVMLAGDIVEITSSDAICAGDVKAAYTKTLLADANALPAVQGRG